MENFEKPDRNERKERPEVLYHASKTAGIKEFVPNRGNFRDEDEGAVIFSTPDKALASIFLIEGHNDSWTQIGYYGDIPVVVINADKEEFIKNDKGGIMYAFPSDTFDFDPDRGMGEKEWTSREPVKPSSEIQCPSALDTMIENGVQVYFVDKKTFDEINGAEHNGYNILVGLTSENESRGKNVRSLKDLDIQERGIGKEVDSKDKFQDFRGVDLSAQDFSQIPVDILMTADFDSQTIWPSTEKLPEGFDPQKILEQGKNPGLGLKELHEQGITGKGIHVAIIDQKLDTDHDEYSDKIVSCVDLGFLKDEEMSMHGPGVASLFVGKNCGVAPEARLHYWSTPAGSNATWEYKAEALNQIINYNKTVEEKDRIRVVSCSTDYPNPGYKGDLNLWIQAIEKAKAAGIAFIDAHDIFDLNFTGGGSPTDKENVDEYKEYLWADGDESFTKDKIIVPSDYRTIASSWNKKEKDGADEYAFNGRGGISWSVPYLAGIFSLMLQVKEDLKMAEMVKIIQDTALTNKKGLKVINPKGIIEIVKSL